MNKRQEENLNKDRKLEEFTKAMHAAAHTFNGDFSGAKTELHFNRNIGFD